MNSSAFISYRRGVSAFVARAVFQDLRANGIDVFMDVESIDSGQFDTIILNQIAARPYFLLILSPGTLERCVEAGDWLLREMEHALKLERVIIPLTTANFSFADCDKYLTGRLRTELPRFNAVNIPHDYFESAMERLRTRFLKPTELSVVPAPETDMVEVQRKLRQAGAEPLVRVEQLGSQGYFEQGMRARESGDFDTAIINFDEAIRLGPQNAQAFYFRGFSRADKGDHEGAIADFSDAIRWDPSYAFAYLRRGFARIEIGDQAGAIADLTEAVKHDPKSASGFYNRGRALYLLGRYDAAIEDCEKAIRLAPDRWPYYHTRGLSHSAKGDTAGAVNDFSRALKLKPDDEASANEMQDYIAQHGKSKRHWLR